MSSVGKIIYEWRKHSHICWEINVLSYGKCTILSELGNYELEKGDFIVIPPNVQHSLISKTGSMDYAVYVDELPYNSNEISVFKSKNTNLIDFFKRLFEAFQNEKIGINDSFEEKARFCLRYIMNIIKTQNIDNSLVSRVKEYISSNYANPLLNEELLAKRFEYNGNYMRRKFKEKFGITPLQYLSEVRLALAKEMLISQPKRSIGKISLRSTPISVSSPRSIIPL